MDNFVTHTLTEWGLSDLINRFQDEGIDKESLYCLEDQEIRDLIPQIGPRSKFKAQLKSLKVLPSISNTNNGATREPQQGRPDIPETRAAQQPVCVSDGSTPSCSGVTQFRQSISAAKKVSKPMTDQGIQTGLPSTVTVGKRKIDLPSEPSKLQPIPKRHCNIELGTCSEDEIMSNVKKIMADVSLKLESQQTKLNSFVKTKIKDLQTDKKELVGVFGRTGAGKSSLINAIIEEKDLLPSGDINACTSVMIKVEANMQTRKYEADVEFITEEEWQDELSSFHNLHQETPLSMETAEIYHDIEEKVLAVYGEDGKNKKPEELISERYFKEIPEFLQSTNKVLTGDTAHQLKSKILKYTRTYTVTGGGKLYWPLVKCVTIRVPKMSTNHLLQHVTLVDLPGTGDRNKSRDQMWKDLLQSCSVVWIVAEVNRAASEKEPWEILANTCRLMGNGGECRQIHFICTKSDIIEDSDEGSAARIHERNNIVKRTVEQEFSKQKKTKKQFSENCFKVFTVSSKEFLKRKTLTPEETEIPRLQKILQDLNDHHSVTLNYVRGAYGIVSLLEGAGLKDGANKKLALCAELEENMSCEFRKIRKTMDEAYNTFERCLSEGVIKSTSSCAQDLRRFFSGKTFQTLKCMMKNKGIHKPKKRKRGKELNLNLKLSKHLIESIDEEFRKTFPNEVKCGAFGGVINKFSLDTRMLIDKYKEVELQLLFLQTEEEKLKLKLGKSTQECKKQSYNSLTETITKQMEECYTNAAGIKGEGAVNKVKEMIEIQVCKTKTIMFENAKCVMLDKMRNLKETELEKLIYEMQESVVMALRTDEDSIPDVSSEFDFMKAVYTYMNKEAAPAARQRDL